MSNLHACRSRGLETGARCRFGLFAAAVIAVVALAGMSTARGAPRPPPLQVDLDAFDAMKKTVQLPDGVTLAYIDTGNPTGPARGADSRLHGQRARLGAAAALPVEALSPHPGGHSRPRKIEQAGVLLHPPRFCLRHQAAARCAVHPAGRRDRSLAGQHHRADASPSTGRSAPTASCSFPRPAAAHPARPRRRSSISPPRSASSRIPSIRTRRS